MMTSEKGPASVDDYISTFPDEIQHKLQELRGVIRKCAPEATEKISYQIPTFFFNGNLVHFAAYANHIGFYPTASGVTNFQDELSGFKHSKGAIQFPLDEPLPLQLVEKIVKFRLAENRSKSSH